MFRPLTLLLVAATLVLPAETTFAQKADAQLTIEDVWRPPEFASPTLSRDGKWLAATVPIRGRMNLAVMNIETRETKPLTGYTNYDVQGIRWVGERILYSLGQNNSPTGPGRFDGGGLFVVHRDGSDARKLSNTVRDTRDQGINVYRSLSFFRSIPDNDEEIIASGNMTDAVSTDLYRLNIRTGRYTLLTQGRPSDRTYEWITDSKLVPRVVSAGIQDTLTEVIYYRKDAESPWKEIARFDGGKPGVFVPLALEDETNTLRVATNTGRDTMGIFRFDPETKRLGELIASHPRYDMGASADGNRTPGVLVDPRTRKLLGYAVEAAKPEVVWLDDKHAATQSALDKALPNRINSFSRTPDGKRLLISSYSDTEPTVYYLLDEEKRRMEELGSTRPWQRGKLPEQKPFVYKTRDGLEIDGYYFLPKDYKPGTKLPTVVHVHGGPHARADTWGANSFGVREGRLFASRGYAVIVPNHRVTPGIGSKVYYAGLGSYGRQMSDDHEDALKWGVEQGFVDSANVCISGASYGGYAALQAQVRNADLWKCSISGLAVTDVYYFLTTGDGDVAFSEPGVNIWKGMLGVKKLDEPIVKEVSPVNFAHKIKKPVFLYAGKEDIRVPIAQIDRMAANLKEAGNPPWAYIVKAGEGHGFGKLENNVELYTKILEFLKLQFGK